MSARRLSKPLTCAKYDVIGIDSDVEAKFIRHVGMASNELGSVESSDTVLLVHMKPPLEREHMVLGNHILGTANLTPKEVSKIDLFIDELIGEYKAQSVRGSAQYIVRPHSIGIKERNGIIVSRQFSCTGFVIEAYHEVLIDLVDTNEARLSGVSLETIVRAYPDQERSLRNSDRRSRVGLDGDGPWDVVLPGYVMNSLSRQEDSIRREAYRAIPGDEYFPSKRGSEAGIPNA